MSLFQFGSPLMSYRSLMDAIAKNKELSPNVANHISNNEQALAVWFSDPLNQHCSINGMIIYASNWSEYKKRKDYYTSPLYKALL